MVPSSPKTPFQPYTPSHRQACLALFDANCPEFFAPNEREDYEVFLSGPLAEDYEVCLRGGAVVAAYGLEGKQAAKRVEVRWILVDPAAQGEGLGRAMMERLSEKARARGVEVLEIGASHRSAPFFAHFGAIEVGRTADGWGPGMHRVDMELVL